MSKQPYRPLSSIDIMAGGPKPAEAAPEPAPQPAPEVRPASEPKEGRRQIGYRPTIDTHEKLRLAAFQQRRTIQDIIDEAVLLWLANRKL